MGNETTQSANKIDKKRKKTLSMTQVREQNANKVVDTTNINDNQIQHPILRNANWFNMDALAKEQESIRKGKMHRTEEMQNSLADNTQTEYEIITAIPFIGIFVQRENNLQTEEITLTHQPSVAANNAPSKCSFAQRARREKERQIVMMDVTINNTYNNTNVGINEENSFTVATSKRALAQPMQELYDKDSSHAKSFRSHIREYNIANAFTSLRVKLDDRILNGRGPKPFSIYRELKHRVWALLPDLGKQAAYAQLYIYDSASTLNTRVSHNPQLNTDVLKIIQDNLIEYNLFVRIYRQTYEVLNDAYSTDNQEVNIHAHLHYSSRTDRCRYNLPSTDEIAVILPRYG
ncbi:hypothetical protein GIB67_024195 [Kingdonia uniflora]|uniref:Helitron helicase-like domain-containing protein n=1 Tax=Kingdonia uniflora TaxID=39325 RepID=A0A7J7LZQ6_9MAGN|nr:hypothetical protein GIB67_024195 [Kingdonia uniflora]